MDGLLTVDDDLIELHEKLEKFATHHQKAGALAAHQHIKVTIEKESKNPRDGSDGMRQYYNGYDDAIKYCLKLIREKYLK